MDDYRAQGSDADRLARAFRNGDEDRIRVILHAEGYEWADPARDAQLRGAVAALEKIANAQTFGAGDGGIGMRNEARQALASLNDGGGR